MVVQHRGITETGTVLLPGRRGGSPTGRPCHWGGSTHHQTRDEAIACAEAAVPQLLRSYDRKRQRQAAQQRERDRRRTERLGPGWDRMRRRVLTEEPHCRKCGEPATDVDHIRPLRRGGTSERENLEALCRRCHEIKTREEQPRPYLSLEPATWVPAWRIAQRLGVSAGTVRRWASTGRIGYPAAVGMMFNRRYWSWPAVADWARRTGRIDAE